jgi:UDP-glucose 4-epimerase
VKFLVTGGLGFIGSHLTQYLVNRGDSVVVIDNQTTGKTDNIQNIFNKIEYINGDIRDYDLLQKSVKDIDGIFHLAALASVQQSFNEIDKYTDVNVNGTENILKLASELKIKVVHASSSSVYGVHEQMPHNENDEMKPINPYAQSKLDAEKIIEKYVKIGLNVIGLRYFNVFGERQSKEYAGVIKLFLEKIGNKESPLVNGDGLQTRDFIFVEDIVKATVTAMQKNLESTFINVGTGKATSILELANTVIKISGLNLEPVHKQALSGEAPETFADTTRIEKLLGFKPESKLDDWLKTKISS